MNQIIPVRTGQPALKAPRGIAVPATIAIAGSSLGELVLPLVPMSLPADRSP